MQFATTVSSLIDDISYERSPEILPSEIDVCDCREHNHAGHAGFTARKIGLGDPIIYYNSAWGGLRPLPGQHVSRVDDAVVTIDSNGFRSKGPDSDTALRILYLGDSVTWRGSSVDDKQLFSEVAADVLRSSGREVYAMNSGVNGTSLMNQAEIFTQWKDPVDVVVWLFPWNDVYRSYATAGFLWPPTKRPSFALVEAIDHVLRSTWLTMFRDEPAAQGSEFVRPEVPAGYQTFFNSVLNERKQKNVAALVRTANAALEVEIPIIVGVTPRMEDEQVSAHSLDVTDALRALENSGVHIFDAHAVFLNDVELSGSFIDAVHFTSAGHQLVGEALGAKLLTVLDQPTFEQ